MRVHTPRHRFGIAIPRLFACVGLAFGVLASSRAIAEDDGDCGVPESSVPVTTQPTFTASSTAKPKPVRVLESLGVVDAMSVHVNGATVDAVLARVDRASGAVVIEYRRSADGGETWTNPVRLDGLVTTPVGKMTRGNDPQIVSRGDAVLIMWTGAGKGPMGSGAMAGAFSSDGGKTWRAIADVTPGQGQAVGSRFPAIAADVQGFHVVWIHAQGEERSLRYSRASDPTKAWTTPEVIDPKICACCWNRIVATPDGKLATLYRGIDTNDMRLATSDDGGKTWTRRGTVGVFSWRFQGCPHVGGGLAMRPADSGADGRKSANGAEGRKADGGAAGRKTAESSGDGAASGNISGVASRGGGAMEIVAAVWTGQSGATGVYQLRSRDSGATWTKPARVETEGWSRHGDIAYVDANTVVVAWDQMMEGVSAVFTSESRDGGATWSSPRRLSATGKAATHPRVMAVNAQGSTSARVFFTQRSAEVDEKGNIMPSELVMAD